MIQTPEKPQENSTPEQPTPSKPTPVLKVGTSEDQTNTSITQPSVLKSVSNEKPTETEQVTTTYVTRIQYRRRVKESPDVIAVIKILMVCLM